MTSMVSESSDRPRAIADPGITMDELRAWYQEYMDADFLDLKLCHLIEAARADKLDHDYIERRVQELAASVHISEGLCEKCQDDFQNWSDPTEMTSEFEKAGIVGRAVNTLELEAAAIAGCQYCALWLGRINRNPEGLADFRKLEARLQLVKGNGTASCSIKCWSSEYDNIGVPSTQMLSLNLPGRTDPIYVPGVPLVRLSATVGFASGNEPWIPLVFVLLRPG